MQVGAANMWVESQVSPAVDTHTVLLAPACRFWQLRSQRSHPAYLLHAACRRMEVLGSWWQPCCCWVSQPCHDGLKAAVQH